MINLGLSPKHLKETSKSIVTAHSLRAAIIIIRQRLHQRRGTENKVVNLDSTNVLTKAKWLAIYSILKMKFVMAQEGTCNFIV
ncbi:MAG: hypothetical protein H6Q54_1455 [Deltaproteobacteria bacterium]|jgi:hypothetical protein|nr:hypothetical protein [Deltaproteobacteria bacterium]MBP1746840.1 hypothetical protein [Deltaproteobacteria bacterium]